MQQKQIAIHEERSRAISARVDAYRSRFAESHIEQLSSSMHREGVTFEQALGMATSLVHTLELAGTTMTFELYEVISDRLNALVHSFVDLAAKSAESFVTLTQKLEYVDGLHQFSQSAMSLISQWEEAMVPHLQVQKI